MKIVCFSEIQWLYVRTRKQQILSRFPDDWEILFLSCVVKGKRNNFLPERDGRIIHVCIPVLKNFPQRSLRAIFSFPPFRLLWNVLLFLWINTVFLLTGFLKKDRVFYVSNIYYAAVLPFMPRSAMVYDCNDDPLCFPDVPVWAGGYFRKLALSADAVTAVSGGLVEKLEDMGTANILHIGNGVDYDLFNAASDAATPDDMCDLAKPVIGYIGAIAQWFDFDLLDFIAASFDDGSIVLVGPVYGDRKDDMRRIADRRRNVHYLGIKPYDRLGAYIAAMDVCMIPLKVNELMRLADPNKLYEYAAVGKPIVTMKYSGDMEELADIVYLADDRDGFIANIRRAVAEGADAEKLKEYAKARSWDRRAEEMVSLIEDLVGGG